MGKAFTKQHIVPQAYLKRFAVKRGKKYIIGTRMASKKKDGIKFFTRSVSDVAYLENYYDTYKQQDGKHWEHFLDKKFDILCGLPLDNIIAKITLSRNNAVVLSKEDKDVLSKIILSQAFRVPAFLDEQLEKSERFIKEYRNQIIEILPDTFPDYKEKIQNISFDSETRKNMILEGIFDESKFDRYCAILHHKTWIVYYNSIRKVMPFITGDNPVLFADLQDQEHQGKMTSLGIANDKTVVLYPLTPAILIGIYAPNAFWGFIQNLDCRKIAVDEMKFITNINIEIMVQSKIHSFLPEPLFSWVNDDTTL